MSGLTKEMGVSKDTETKWVSKMISLITKHDNHQNKQTCHDWLLVFYLVFSRFVVGVFFSIRYFPCVLVGCWIFLIVYFFLACFFSYWICLLYFLVGKCLAVARVV
jgi:hypothetical protein